MNKKVIGISFVLSTLVLCLCIPLSIYITKIVNVNGLDNESNQEDKNHTGRDDDDKLTTQQRDLFTRMGKEYKTTILRSSDIYLGEPTNGSIVLVSYYSYTCHHCKTYNDFIFPSIKESLIDSGEIVYIYRLENPRGNKVAANAERCVINAFGKDAFIEYHEVLLDLYARNNYLEVSSSTLLEGVSLISEDPDVVSECIKNLEHGEEIDNFFLDDLPLYPAYLFGVISDDDIITGFQITGNWDYAIYEEFVNILHKQPEIISEIKPEIVNYNDEIDSFAVIYPKIGENEFIYTPKKVIAYGSVGETISTTLTMDYHSENTDSVYVNLKLIDISYNKDFCSLDSIERTDQNSKSAIDWVRLEPNMQNFDGHHTFNPDFNSNLYYVDIKIPNDVSPGIYTFGVKLSDDINNHELTFEEILPYFIIIGEEAETFSCS